jgi:hypothetical protein
VTVNPRVEAKRQAVDAALSIADEVAKGTLDPTSLEVAAVAECRTLFSTVAGPEDELWELQVDVCRQVLAAGGVPGDELAEWAAVYAPPPSTERVPSWIEQALAMSAEDDAV